MRRRDFRNMDWNDPQWQERMQEFQKRRTRGKIFFGIAVAIIGILWILQITLHIPFDWAMQWPIGLMVLGLLIGIKNSFQNHAWWILMLIGGANVVETYYPQHSQFIWPVGMIIAGVAIALRPKRKHCYNRFQKMDKSISSDSTLNIDVTFGGRKEMVTARDFRSGNISVTFGGCELNFMQSDLAESTAVLDLRVAFGGVEIIVPSHWDVQNEVNPSFGNVEDERSIKTSPNVEGGKTLILRGSCNFGSVEIKSY